MRKKPQSCDRCESLATVHLRIVFTSDHDEILMDLCGAHANEVLDMLRQWNEGIVV